MKENKNDLEILKKKSKKDGKFEKLGSQPRLTED